MLATAANVCLRSEEFATAPWGLNTGVTAANNTTDVLDPLGGVAASKLVYDGSGTAGGFLVLQATATAAAPFQPNAIGVWMRAPAGQSIDVRISENASAGFSAFTLTEAWQFITRTATEVVGAAVHVAIYRAVADNAARTYYAWGGQASPRGTNRLATYAKTTAAAVLGPVRNAVATRGAVAGRVARSGRVAP